MQLLKHYRTAGHIKTHGGRHSAPASLDREWRIQRREQITPSISCTHPTPHAEQHPGHGCLLRAGPCAKQAT